MIMSLKQRKLKFKPRIKLSHKIYTNKFQNVQQEEKHEINLSSVIYHIILFKAAYEQAESSKSCNLIGSKSGRYIMTFSANPGGIIGSFIHKFVCCL